MSLKQKQIELVQAMVEIAEELGWNIIIPKGDLDEPTPGLLMGTPKFMEDIHMDPDQIEDLIEFNVNREEMH